MPIVDSGGLQIHYEVVGDGRPIVLVHGFTQSFDTNWREIGWVDHLLARDRRVIGLDCRGHGRSGKPHDASAYAGNTMADDVLTVMDVLGVEQAELVGYSMGGWIALNLLARFPHRFLCVAAGGSGVRPFRQAEVMIEALEADDPRATHDAAARRFRTFIDSNPDNDRKALAAVQRAERAAADAALLAQVQVASLLFVGAEDPTFDAVRQAAQLSPASSFVVLSGETHFTALAARSCTDAVNEFLSRQTLVR
jgi:pimeloyl-ACP methyl ester carboxylesterase